MPTFPNNADPSTSKKFPPFVCPRCRIEQRRFFGIDSAPGQFESPAGYFAFYFAIYMLASLFIFGLEEGWTPLDCIYFSVITLTTAGLGDLVPTTIGGKVICSIFIYFGVACIGLLLGSLLASGMDDASRKASEEQLLESCIHCQRRHTNPRNAYEDRSRDNMGAPKKRRKKKRWFSERNGNIIHNYSFLSHNSDLSLLSNKLKTNGSQFFNRTRNRAVAVEGIDFTIPPDEEEGLRHLHLNGNGNLPTSLDSKDNIYTATGIVSDAINIPKNNNNINNNNSWNHSLSSTPRSTLEDVDESTPMLSTSTSNNNLEISPFPNRRKRQDHTRHLSFDHTNFSHLVGSMPGMPLGRVRLFSADNNKSKHPKGQTNGFANIDSDNFTEDDNSVFSSTDSDSSNHLLQPLNRMRAAKFVFLTLKQAVVNSVFIIAIGAFGFHYIEKLGAVDAFYFTTVLLTTVGYGDLAPKTPEGKMFATVYVLVAGTVLLNNMSTISMIPLELRRRRVERAVLSQVSLQNNTLKPFYQPRKNRLIGLFLFCTKT